MFKIDYKDRYWNYQLFCAVYLSLGLTDWKVGFLIAITMSVIQLINPFIDHRRLEDFPLHVRIAYTLMLLVALPESMNWLYWLLMAVSWTYVLFGYCLLSRVLSLMPFISKRPFTFNHLRETFLAQPVKNILDPA